MKRPRQHGLVRTAFALLPLQITLRGGEALFPILLAAWFGRSAQTDLYYLLAATFAFVGAAITGAFQDSGAIAVLVEVESTAPASLPQVAGSLLGYTLAIASAVVLTTGALAGAVVSVTCTERALALGLVALMCAAAIAASVRAFCVGLHNATGSFSAHPLASGLGMLLTLALIRAGRDVAGVLVIPLALCAGELLAVALLLALARRRLGFRLRPRLRRVEPLRRISALARYELLGSVITRVNPLIDQLMAGLAGVVGGGTLLRYAGDVASLPTSVLQAVLFPVLLRKLALEARNPLQFAGTVRGAVGAVVGLMLASSVALALFARPLSSLLFRHGEMDVAGVGIVAGILPWALVGCAPFGALLVLARAHIALQNSRIMPAMGVLNAVLNATFNALLVRPLGLPGIALSTSLTYAVVALVFWWRLKERSSTSRP